MFAVISDGGRQYRVQEGDRLVVDYREGLDPGKDIRFESVLLANDGAASTIGKPLIDGATVVGKVEEAVVKGPKLEITKFRRRKNSRRHTGHRQKYTSIRITGIKVPGLAKGEKPAAKPEKAPAAKSEK